MKDFIVNSMFFSVFLCFMSYEIGGYLHRKTKLPIFNPLLVATVLTVGLILLLNIEFESFYSGSKYISYFLTPATVCLAVPLYEKLNLLRRNIKAIIAGILAGMLTSAGFVLLFCILFNLSHREYVTLLPKSITTAIGMGLAEELGGIGSVTAVMIIITGIFGNISCEFFLRLFKIEDPIAKGIAIGSSSHAAGTAKAMEIGDIEGAMSSLATAVAGVCTVAVASIFANFY